MLSSSTETPFGPKPCSLASDLFDGLESEYIELERLTGKKKKQMLLQLKTFSMKSKRFSNQSNCQTREQTDRNQKYEHTD